MERRRKRIQESQQKWGREKAKTMHVFERRNKLLGAVSWGILALFVALAARPMQAQDSQPQYPNRAPIEQYLMDRDAEIALARSGAPDSISHDATVLVLGRDGYETAVQGTNGFVCFVERGWGAPFDLQEFWSPKVHGANCINPPAVRSVLPIIREKAKLLMAGESKAEILDALRASYAKNELPALEPGAVSYMMGKGSYLTDRGRHNVPHIMLYSASDAASWGANFSGSPIGDISFWFASDQSNPQMKGLPVINVFAISVQNWSDGTPVVPKT